MLIMWQLDVVSLFSGSEKDCSTLHDSVIVMEVVKFILLDFIFSFLLLFIFQVS